MLDDDQLATVGEGAERFPVVATVNGHSWRTSVARMGGESLVGLSREVRAAAGAEAGDRVEVTLELDGAPREVDLPDALVRALAGDPQAAAAFARLSFTDRREYVRWVGEAKRDETRERRVREMLERLRQVAPLNSARTASSSSSSRVS